MILAVNNLKKSYDGNDILTNVSFHIEAHDRLAVVGSNGAGKTTLIKQLAGEETPDGGTITIPKDIRTGYLSQLQDPDSDISIYDEVISVKKDILAIEDELRRLELMMNAAAAGDAVGSGTAAGNGGYADPGASGHSDSSGNSYSSKYSENSGSPGAMSVDDIYNRYALLSHRFELEGGYAIRSNAAGILKGLGFTEDEFDRRVSVLSGGQKTRLALGRLLMSAPDILMLDEPTNHLDIASVSWLEAYLRSWKGTVIIVSHDRYFLDRIVNKVLDIENGIGRLYTGNYTAFAEKKAALRKEKMRAWLNNQAEIKHQQEVIEKLRQFNREKSIKRAESREKALARIERLDKPFDADDAMRLHFTPSKLSGKDVLFGDNLSKSFGEKHLFSGFSLDVKRGEKLAIIGPNGTGKTTLLKIINGTETADTGELEFGTRVEPAYYDQEHHVLDPDNTVFDEISDAYPYMNNTEIRNLLASFLFTGDDVFKYIRDLSGGEKGRLSLAKLMLSKANLLLLDEPTNHLDITSKEILEEAIRNYEGTVIYVSHDRYFINRTATRILELDHNSFINYLGNYDYYLEKLADPEFDKAKAVSGRAADNRPAGVKAVGNTSGANAVGKAAGNAADRNTVIGYSNVNNGGYGSVITGTVNKNNTKAGPMPAFPGSIGNSGNIPLNYQEQKEKKQQLQKLRSALSRCEASISEHEERISGLDHLMSLPENAVNSAKLNELIAEQNKLSSALEELYEKWEQLSEQIESFS